MAIDDAERPEASGHDEAGAQASERPESRIATGEYTWLDYLEEFADGEAESVRESLDAGDVPAPEVWERAGIDPAAHLGFDPTRIGEVLGAAGASAAALDGAVGELRDREDPPVAKGWYTWEDYKREYYYDEEGEPPTDGDGNVEPFDPSDELGFPPEATTGVLGALGERADELADVVDERTVDVAEELDEDAFFSTAEGTTTIVNRYDLEKEVPLEKKGHFREIERYWVNKPYAFVVIFHSVKENEKKYYLVEPHETEIEAELTEFLTGKLRTSIKYAEEGVRAGEESDRRRTIEEETFTLLERYDLYAREEGGPFDALDGLGERLGLADGGTDGTVGQLLARLGLDAEADDDGGLEGIAARPEPAVLADDPETLTEYQVEKLLYYLQRDFIGYERIDGIKHDINVEDISCDGYHSPVFVYHSDYEQIITNVYHGEEELDDFVVKLAQRSGKGISKRRPQVDATLPDGSRAQLTLGKEVSDHGTNYTIRQFKDVPFTPIDLVNWNTFSLDEMAFLWLCIENHKSLIFAGGTASGKTTSLNAISLFIPSNTKIVSIEDTREVELPQRNWIASVTRPSFTDDDKGDVDEFDLLEAALRQRPDYIVMGEIRGEEGRTLFQVMSTGHTTYTTFHADSVGEVLKRFTTDPINVSKTMFTALDLVSIQTATRVGGNKVRRNKTLTEINRYDPENDEINVQDVYQWQAESDQFLQMGDSNTLEEIKFDRGWNETRLRDEKLKRKAVLAYLIENGLNTYTQVAATIQAFINDPETILTLMANDELEASLEDLREMESVLIDIDPEKEEMVPRPDAPDEVIEECEEVLSRAEDRFLAEFRGEETGEVADALAMDDAPEVTPGEGDGSALADLAEAVESDIDAGASVDAGSDADEPVDVGRSAGAESGGIDDATDGDGDAGSQRRPAGADSVREFEDGGADADGPDAEGEGDADAASGGTDPGESRTNGGPPDQGVPDLGGSDAGRSEPGRRDPGQPNPGRADPGLDEDDPFVEAVESLDDDEPVVIGSDPEESEGDRSEDDRSADGTSGATDPEDGTADAGGSGDAVDGAVGETDDAGSDEDDASEEWEFGGFEDADPEEEG